MQLRIDMQLAKLLAKGVQILFKLFKLLLSAVKMVVLRDVGYKTAAKKIDGAPAPRVVKRREYPARCVQRLLSGRDGLVQLLQLALQPVYGRIGVP